jgi:hypothetical protein
LQVLIRRDQGDRQLHGARQAYRRRASACARDLAHVPAHLHARTGPDRFLHPQRDLRSIQAHPRNRHERASNRPQVHRAIRLFSLPRAIARESSNLPQMRLGPLLAQFVAHSGGPGAVSWRRAPRGLLPRRSGSPCHGALADVRLTTGQPLGKSSTPVSATDHCSFGTNSVISEPSRTGRLQTLARVPLRERGRGSRRLLLSPEAKSDDVRSRLSSLVHRERVAESGLDACIWAGARVGPGRG